MTKINLRKAAVGLLLAVPMLLAGISGGAAQAAEGAHIMGPGNNNATVTGVPFCNNINVPADCWTWEPAGTFVDCPSAHFCLYTNEVPANGGKVFSLYRCREYALQNWLDRGYVWNNNTGGAPGYLRGSNHATLPGGFIEAGTGKGYNFFPVWFVKAC